MSVPSGGDRGLPAQVTHLVAIGGSDAGISAALRARELDPSVRVTVIVEDEFPNFSICGIPYLVTGEVPTVRGLAHRSRAELLATGMEIESSTRVTTIDPDTRSLQLLRADGNTETIGYDELIIGTGATSFTPPIAGLHGEGALTMNDGVHLLHSMGDAIALLETLESGISRAIIIGAGYIGLEMVEGLHARGIEVALLEQLPEVLPSVDHELGALVNQQIAGRGIAVHTATTVNAITRSIGGESGRLEVAATTAGNGNRTLTADLVLVVAGVRPDTSLASAAGIELGAGGAIAVDREMRTNLPHIFAAGDCATTFHRQLGVTYLPLGTTAHKQGRIAGENALGGHAQFAGSLGSQVLKVFDLVIARTGLRDHEAVSIGAKPLSVSCIADDHKAYYPGARPLSIRITGDRESHRLLGLQIVGALGAEIAKRVDIAATAIFHQMRVEEMSELDLTYTPPLGSPWDAVQIAAQAWSRAANASDSGS